MQCVAFTVAFWQTASCSLEAGLEKQVVPKPINIHSDLCNRTPAPTCCVDGVGRVDGVANEVDLVVIVVAVMIVVVITVTIYRDMSSVRVESSTVFKLYVLLMFCFQSETLNATLAFRVCRGRPSLSSSLCRRRHHLRCEWAE